MKEYKYKINGNEYNVAIENIEGNIAHIQLNGVAYDVELPEQPKAAKPLPLPLVATLLSRRCLA